jgi:hypothetical protein
MNREEVLERILTDDELEAYRLQDWEHYHRFFKETKHFYYYIHSRGYVEKYPKEMYAENGPLSWEFRKVNSQLYKRNKKNKHEEYVSVIVDHRRYPLKMLVASTFSRIWKPGSRIMHINGKITDCSFTNLLIVPPGSSQKATHRGKRIEVLIDRSWLKFDTLKEAAVYLNISLSSFRRYLKNDTKIKKKNENKYIRYRYY